MKSGKEISISDARENLESLVRDAERGATVALTRRGEAVAVLVSKDRFQTHDNGAASLAKAIDDFRNNFDLEEMSIESALKNVRNC